MLEYAALYKKRNTSQRLCRNHGMFRKGVMRMLGEKAGGGGVPGRKNNGQNNYIWSTEYLKQTNNFYSDVF